jgi:hypothetical protein
MNKFEVWLGREYDKIEGVAKVSVFAPFKKLESEHAFVDWNTGQEIAIVVDNEAYRTTHYFTVAGSRGTQTLYSGKDKIERTFVIVRDEGHSSVAKKDSFWYRLKELLFGRTHYNDFPDTKILDCPYYILNRRVESSREYQMTADISG